MQFLAIAALLPSLALATSYRKGGGSGPSLQSTGNAGTENGNNECGVSSFTPIPLGDGPPLVSDCKYMLDHVLPSAKSWPVGLEQKTISSYGTCSFVVSARGGNGKADIGDDDVRDLVNDSIRQFSKQGKVGCHGSYALFISSAGTMPCDKVHTVNNPKKVTVDWAIVNTGGKKRAAFRA